MNKTIQKRIAEKEKVVNRVAKWLWKQHADGGEMVGEFEEFKDRHWVKEAKKIIAIACRGKFKEGYALAKAEINADLNLALSVASPLIREKIRAEVLKKVLDEVEKILIKVDNDEITDEQGIEELMKLCQKQKIQELKEKKE